MNKIIENIVNESFKSKAQQRLFYANANDDKKSTKEKRKWKKLATEFSKKTDYKEIPDKVEDIEEIVDELGVIGRSKKPTNFNSKFTRSMKTNDQKAKETSGQMGTFMIGGTNQPPRIYAWEGKMLKKNILEVDLSGNLGADGTILKDLPYDKALKYFMKNLGLSKEDSIEKMKKLGYSDKLPDDKVIMVENPKKFIEEYVDELLKNKNNYRDLISKEEEIEEVEINPIVKRQISSLKNTMKTYGIKPQQVLKNLTDSE
jgi:hypothetical protein